MDNNAIIYLICIVVVALLYKLMLGKRHSSSNSDNTEGKRLKKTTSLATMPIPIAPKASNMVATTLVEFNTSRYRTHDNKMNRTFYLCENKSCKTRVDIYAEGYSYHLADNIVCKKCYNKFDNT